MIRKQPVDISFARGLQQKVDPWRVEAGNFLALTNTVFQKEGLLQKRNGYTQLAALPDTSYTYLTTLNDNLVALGDDLAAYSNPTEAWGTQGQIAPMAVNVLPVIRNSLNQTQCDSVTAPNGLVCVVYTEVGNSTTDYKYAILDATTGQSIVAPTLIPVPTGAVSGSPRTFLLGNFFVIVFTTLISATSRLQYVVIPTANPHTISPALDAASAYTPSPGLSWDGVVASNSLYVAYNTQSGGQSVQVKSLTLSGAASALGPTSQGFSGATTFAGSIASLMSVTADETVSNPVVYLSFWSASAGAFVAAVSLSLGVVLAPTLILASGTTVDNVASAAQNGAVLVLLEIANNYGYDATIPTHYTTKTSVTSVGIVTGPTIMVRSVGLASKAFLYNGVAYALMTYQSPYQNTYFMVDATTSTEAMPVVTAKLAYENGGGYLTLGLPAVGVLSGVASVAYLFKDLVEASSTASQNNSQQLANSPVYSQTGVNVGSFDLLDTSTDAAEMAQSLNFSGGFLWSYDGVVPVEQNFFLWPDSVEVTTSTTSITTTGTVTTGSFVITAVASTAGLGPGLLVTGTGIPSGTFVVGFDSTTITMTNAATGNHTAETITLAGNIGPQPDGATNIDAYYVQAVYEWTDNRGLVHRSAPSIPVPITTTGTGTTGTYIFSYDVPTLRLTYKIESPIKITTYRWSVKNQVYYETTSILYPTLNNTSVDYVTIVDGQNDSQILGNAIIYTTGGVVEDVNPPASNIITTFDNRLWLVDAEDPNLWWFSKQVIEGVPVEMSDLLTYYLAPSTASQGPTGPITAGAPMDDKLISFKKNAIYYTNGTGPDNTGANSQYSQPIFITSTVGCANQQSIVFTDVGLMFQSDKGIWLLGRDLSTTYIGAPVENYNSSRVLAAVGVPETNQVRFTLDNGMTLMYDYFFRQWGTFSGIPGVSSCIQNDLHCYINAEGTAYQESPGVYLDGYNPVLMSFTTSWLKLAGLQGYQRAYFFYLLGEYLSPHWLQLGIAYDYNPAISQANLIRPDNYSPVGGTDPSESPAGQQSPGGGPTQVEAWRVFLSRQRCSAIQLTLQEVFDSSLGVQPGAGLTLSGLMLIAGVKNVFRTQSAGRSVGGG